MTEKQKISLVLADVDGTLVTEQKVLTKRAQAAVHGLRGAGIRFAVTSGRPAKGMAMLVDPLQIDTPISGTEEKRTEPTSPAQRRHTNCGRSPGLQVTGASMDADSRISSEP